MSRCGTESDNEGGADARNPIDTGAGSAAAVPTDC